MVGAVVPVPRQVTSWEQLKQARKDRERQALEREIGRLIQQTKNSSSGNTTTTTTSRGAQDTSPPAKVGGTPEKSHLAINRGTEEKPEIDLGGYVEHTSNLRSDTCCYFILLNCCCHCLLSIISPVGLFVAGDGTVLAASYMFNAVLRFSFPHLIGADKLSVVKREGHYEGIVVQDDGMLGPSGMCSTEVAAPPIGKHKGQRKGNRKRGKRKGRTQLHLHVASYENHKICQFAL